MTLPAAQAERARNHVGKTCIFGIRPEDIYDKGIATLGQIDARQHRLRST